MHWVSCFCVICRFEWSDLFLLFDRKFQVRSSPDCWAISIQGVGWWNRIARADNIYVCCSGCAWYEQNLVLFTAAHSFACFHAVKCGELSRRSMDSIQTLQQVNFFTLNLLVDQCVEYLLNASSCICNSQFAVDGAEMFLNRLLFHLPDQPRRLLAWIDAVRLLILRHLQIWKICFVSLFDCKFQVRIRRSAGDCCANCRAWPKVSAEEIDSLVLNMNVFSLVCSGGDHFHWSIFEVSRSICFAFIGSCVMSFFCLFACCSVYGCL